MSFLFVLSLGGVAAVLLWMAADAVRAVSKRPQRVAQSER